MPSQVINLAVTGLLALILFVFAAILGGYDWLPGAIDLKRGQLERARHAVQPGTARPEAAKALIEILGPQGIWVYRSDDERRWYVSNWLEFFEGHWVLTVCFDSQGVTGTKFGTGDNADIAPVGAPPARGMCP